MEEMVMPRRGRGGALSREFDSDYECSKICVPRFDANRYNRKNRIMNRGPHLFRVALLRSGIPPGIPSSRP